MFVSQPSPVGALGVEVHGPPRGGLHLMSISELLATLPLPRCHPPTADQQLASGQRQKTTLHQEVKR